ncbi:hypothetical protein V565_199910 [Rhizoctonia solani 123E]|uniref:Uncharacterized protein n=1 Tax=Rhizoctonia solani 123E TaxID=1423351 RepID=A0A074RI08_9AGAM|nr:hypothetical protein V565_199910 [Rhizoctonia solani 123E]
MAPVANTTSGGKARAVKSPKRHRFDPIPKRVTKGFRVPFNYHEWTKLVEAWYAAEIQGYPDKGAIVGLSVHFGRCVKQVNTFYTNRRQDVSNKETGKRKLTEEELHELLWAKYKGTVEERMIAKQRGLSVREASSSSSTPSSNKSSSPTPSLTMSEGSSIESTSSEGSLESASSADLPAVDLGYSEWSATVTPAMAALLEVVSERLSELEAGQLMLSL